MIAIFGDSDGFVPKILAIFYIENNVMVLTED
jgi:hypothetical protein